MPYVGDKLADLFHEEALDDFAMKAEEDVSKHLLDTAVENTPVHTLLPGETVSERGRAPGTLKRRWHRGPIRRIGPDHYECEVYNTDPIAPDVEYDTKPHVIPHGGSKAGKTLRFRVSPSGHVVFAKEVHHPGTRGAYMMRRAAATTQAQVERLMEPALREWARRQVELMRRH